MSSVQLFYNMVRFQLFSTDNVIFQYHKQRTIRKNWDKNIEFKTITKKLPSSEHSLIDYLNFVIDNPAIRWTNKIDHSESFSYFHVNISSLPFPFEEFFTLLSENWRFGIVGISESRLKSEKSPISSIHLTDYKTEYTTTQSRIDGTLL